MEKQSEWSILYSAAKQNGQQNGYNGPNIQPHYNANTQPQFNANTQPRFNANNQNKFTNNRYNTNPGGMYNNQDNNYGNQPQYRLYGPNNSNCNQKYNQNYNQNQGQLNNGNNTANIEYAVKVSYEINLFTFLNISETSL